MDNKTASVSHRNEFIDLLRFLFCLIIFLHHAGHVTGGVVTLMPSGGLAADAFFMLTGYYTVRHVSKRYGKKSAEDGAADSGRDEMTKRPVLYSVKYTLLKLWKAFPYVVFGTGIVYLLECVIDKLLQVPIGGWIGLLSRLKYMLVEITYLPLTGIMGELNALTYRNAPMWYLSALLIALPIVMIVCILLHKPFKYVIVWIGPVLLQRLMYSHYGGVLPWAQMMGPVNSGYVRGLSSLLMGGAVYFASEAVACASEGLRSKAADGVLRTVLTAAELALLAMFLRNVINGVSEFRELSSLYLIAGALGLNLSGATFTSRLHFPPAALLGRLSLPIFCLHWGIYRWVASFLGSLGWQKEIPLVFVLCVVTALVLMAIVDFLGRGFRWLKGRFVRQDEKQMK